MRARQAALLVFLLTNYATADEPYQIKEGEFPPLHSERRARGELVESDFIHRTGQFQVEGTGELVDFSLTPYAAVRYHNAEADLRDIPLGTSCDFYLYPDTRGGFAKVATLQAEPEVDPNVAEEQRKKHNAFVKARGLAAWIDRVDGKKLTITFFGDPAGLHALLKDENVVPEQWVKDHRRVTVVVANEELRTYNPPVDGKGATVLEARSVPVDNYGCSGEQWVVQPDLLLEGFRKGRIVRIFFQPTWLVEDMPFGEGLYSEVFGVDPSGPEANQFPFRTDFGNASLPWYQLQPGKFPPRLSEHRVSGELVSVDPAQRSGEFRTDGTGEVVAFTLLPFASVMSLGAEADLRDLSLGMRCQFYLHPDAQGGFTKVSVITDEFTRLTSEKLSYRLDAAKLGEGKLFVAWQVPPVENDKNRMEQPPDYGREVLTVDNTTRVWNGNQAARLADLKPGDKLLVNLTGRTASSRGKCIDIWIGADTHKAASAEQLTKHNGLLKQNGLPAWVDRMEGKKLVVTPFYGANRNDFKSFFDENFKQGEEIRFALADDTLRIADPSTMLTGRFTDNQNIPVVAYGYSGTRVTIESNAPIENLVKGSIVRLFAPDWPVGEASRN